MLQGSPVAVVQWFECLSGLLLLPLMFRCFSGSMFQFFKVFQVFQCSNASMFQCFRRFNVSVVQCDRGFSRVSNVSMFQWFNVSNL